MLVQGVYCRNVFLNQLPLHLLPLLQNTLKLLTPFLIPDNFMSLKCTLFLRFADLNFVFTSFVYSATIGENEALKDDAKTIFNV